MQGAWSGVDVGRCFCSDKTNMCSGQSKLFIRMSSEKKKVLSPKIQWHLFQLLWANINGNFSVIPLHLVCTSFIANAALHCQYLFAYFSQGYVFMGTKMLSTQQMLNKCLLEECTVFSGMNTHKCQVTASLCEHLKSLVLYLIIFLAFQETRF